MITGLKAKGRKQAQRMYVAQVCDVCGGTETLQHHHKDGNQMNNEVWNIAILCQTHHTAVHMELDSWGKGKTLQLKPCPVCQLPFQPRRATQVLCKQKECHREWGRISALTRWSGASLPG